MRKSKCRFCVRITALADKRKDDIHFCYCERDQYDEEIGCNPLCNGYCKAKEVKESEVKK